MTYTMGTVERWKRRNHMYADLPDQDYPLTYAVTSAPNVSHRPAVVWPFVKSVLCALAYIVLGILGATAVIYALVIVVAVWLLAIIAYGVASLIFEGKL